MTECQAIVIHVYAFKLQLQVCHVYSYIGISSPAPPSCFLLVYKFKILKCVCVCSLQLARTYSYAHSWMHKGWNCGDFFDEGITNGASWYSLSKGEQCPCGTQSPGQGQHQLMKGTAKATNCSAKT